jgi:poly [ADP-ribose] polymerase 2/3/4
MTQPPDIRRKFQLTDLERNNNKYWQIEFWAATDRCRVVYGRVGAEVVQDDTRTLKYVESKIAEKLRKGYVEIDLPAVPVVTAPIKQVIDPKVADLIDLIFNEAGERIAQYLAVGITALSQNQIDRGRTVLLEAQGYKKRRDKKALLAAIQTYYNLIPTQLPRKIDPDVLVAEFDFSEQETRLSQLEVALVTYTATGKSIEHYQMLGAEIHLLSQTSRTYEQITDYIARTAGGTARIQDIYTVTIPHERAAWEQCKIGKKNIAALFHGTRNHNVRHILNKGLIIPKMAANGSRMGRGIYFADMAQRSLSYTGSTRRHAPHMLFVCDVALGRSKQLDGSHPHLTAAPRFHQSVHGVASWSGMDEWIVYRPEQATIRAVVTLKQ